MLLERAPGVSVVAEADDAAAALAAAVEHAAAVLVLDLNMPGQPSLEMLNELADVAPDLAVVILTMERDPVQARLAVESGARAYVLKQAVEEELLEAIRTVAAGGTHMSREVEALLAETNDSAGPPDGLTERELEVLRLAALGHTNVEIAERLEISVRTVETHRTHIQQKTLLSSRPELVRYALEHDLI